MNLKIMLILTTLGLVLAGCSETPVVVNPRLSEKDLRDRSRAILIEYVHAESPVLRSHAIEALADTNQTTAANFILEGLNDPYWGVRFTACMAVMQLRHAPAKPLLEKCIRDPEKSVQAAAAGALHVLGNRRYTSRLGDFLFDKNEVVRRNAAMVLGRMADPAALKILRAGLRDEDLSTKLQVLEAMTLLGNKRATRLMITSCQSAFDDECFLAMLTLARVKCRESIDVIGYVYDRSASPNRLGMRMVSARALAMLGDDRGRNAALAALNYYPGRMGQAATIRYLAALALGEIKDKTVLGNLEQALADNDPDVQIAAASAVLKTLNDDLPF